MIDDIASVRWVHIRGREETALVIECEKFANCIVYDQPIRVYTLPKRDAAKCRIVEKQGTPYPVTRSAEMFLRDSFKHGITQGAKRLILDLINSRTAAPLKDVSPSENDYGRPSPVLPDDARAIVPQPTGSPVPVPKAAVLAAPTGKRPETRAKPTGKPRRDDNSGGDDPSPGRGTAGIPAKLASEFGIEPTDVRKLLRKAGLSKPYTDYDLCKAAIEGKL